MPIKEVMREVELFSGNEQDQPKVSFNGDLERCLARIELLT
jgi:hypothetical protein